MTHVRERAQLLLRLLFMCIVITFSAGTSLAAASDVPSIQIVQGNKQTVQLAGAGTGSAVFQPIGVVSVDRYDRGIPNVKAVFACTVASGAKCFIGSSESSGTILTGPNGVASAVVASRPNSNKVQTARSMP
jgi:hypothetical protein